MFAVIGWLACVVFMGYASLTAALVLVNCGSVYTIGGAVNSNKAKIFSALFAIGVLVGWYFVFAYAPFSISFSAALSS